MKKLLAVVFAVSCLPALAQDVDGLAAETKKTVLPVVPKVMRAMQEAVNDKGVAEAIPVCKEQAPKLIQEVREATGWSIRRVSLKTRNAERGAPDGWEKAVLAEFEQRAAAGEKPDTLEKSAVLDENGKKTFRYMKALPVADICLQCHGPVEGLDAGLKAKLAALYPDDHAVGYGKGQIRGALTVKRLLP